MSATPVPASAYMLALAPETFGRAALVPFVPTRAIFRYRYRGLPAAIGPALWSVRGRGAMGEPTGPKTGIPFFLKTTRSFNYSDYSE